jgi:hypothetical protein
MLLEGGFVSEKRYHSNSFWPEIRTGREAIAAGSQPSINSWGRPLEFMPLYMANSDLAQMKKPLALGSKKRVQMIGLGHPRPQNELTYTGVSQRVSQKNFHLVDTP